MSTYVVVREPGNAAKRTDLADGAHWVGGLPGCSVRAGGPRDLLGLFVVEGGRVRAWSVPGQGGLARDGSPLQGETVGPGAALAAAGASLLLGAYDGATPPAETPPSSAASPASPASPAPTGPDAFSQASEATLRLLTGQVSRSARARALQVIEDSGDSYAWKDVVTHLTADPVDRSELLRRLLLVQRNLLVRGNPEGKPSRAPVSVRMWAAVLSRSMFFAAYTVVVLILLLALKTRWPAMDIYAGWRAFTDLLARIF